MLPGICVAQLNITVNGTLGDLDGNMDMGTGEANIVTAVVNCWSARVLTNRNFTLTVAGGPLGGGTIGQGRVNTVSMGNFPLTGSLTMDNDGSTVYFVDPTPNASTEWTVDDAASPWRLRGGPAMVDLYSVFNHETGHALAWLSAVGCGGTNPGYDGLLNPTPPFTTPSATCVAPFPTRGQPQLAGCVQLVGANYNVSLRGDGVGMATACNELSHPGITGDLMLGVYTNNARETASIEDVDLFRVAFGDTVNLPPLVNAGNDIVSECNTIGGSDVTLDGSGSTDSENDALSYNWTCPGIALSTPDSMMASGFFALDQTVSCRLDATDPAACPPDSDFVQVRVEDTTDPDITCPVDVTIECDQPTDPFHTGQGMADDICDAAPQVAFADAVASGACADEEVITRTWTATDASDNAMSCNQSINVVDATAPVIACNAPATIVPPDAPISFTATATDNCDPNVLVEIVDFDCFFTNPAGKLVDKTKSCVVRFAGDTLTVFDSGGVGDTITWTVRAADRCGEVSEVVCEIDVVNPGKGKNH